MEIKTLAFGPVSNTYLIKGTKGYIQVDCGCYYSKEEGAKIYADAGIDPKDVCLIFITHGHFDHAGCLDIAKELTGAPIICHQKALEFIKEGKFPAYKARNGHGQMFIDQIAGPAPVQVPGPVNVDIAIGDQDFDLSSFGIDAKAVHTPGHIASAISLFCSDGSIFVGDTVLADAFDNGTCTLAQICDDKEGLFKSVERIIAEGKEIYSGHGGPFTVEEVKKAFETAKAE